MRLSNNLMYQNNLTSILDNQSEVNKAMQQVTTQKRVLSASDDPSATARAMLYSDRIETNEQYSKNLTMLESRLGTQESVLENIKNSITQAYTLAIRAGNGSVTDIDKNAIAQEIKAIQASVLDMMNSKSEDGRYIFSGYQDNTQTYGQDPATGKFVYQGDQGQHKIKVAEGVEIRSSDNGFDVFEKAENRLNVVSNTATTAGGATNGTVYIKEQGEFDKFHKSYYNASPTAPATANDFQITLGAGNTYALTQNGTPVQSGTYTDNKIVLGGMEIKFSGGPTGTIDFTLEKPAKDNVLNTLENLYKGLTTPGTSVEDFEQVVADAVVGLDNAKNKVSYSQASLGGRKNTADLISKANADLDINNKSARADIIELDMTEAITNLQKHETALQASQATFGRLSNLSLFDYIR
ncbi:flagellar hook-associated protein FlgL [Pseudoalteromonas xiamenensis]|uniref:flagellar hook-associated protein FlgL n=1 Tax=Pseudoalteromonas xiamenensis TaxID=882626 RepID=UPI0027E57751|nr:flagellar hook-associated protein FlgL [Pseudoalteromonas xiamenensis]WMN59370.1 flagellar hook-associated protein FlgL [Pseudoalteromonas xiamenensis]